MPSQLLNLPVHIPWKLIAASRDMMDFFPMGIDNGAQIGPPPWRSSLAIYAYEPKPEILDEALCDQRLTFFKLTSSVTGYQPSKGDKSLIVDYTDRLNPEIGTKIEDYFPCYGVLLNVSVFPGPLWSNIFDTPPTENFPHIIDLEPKKRDLYQAATESGEILTASRNEVKSDKSFTTVEHTELGVNASATVPLGEGPGSPNATAGITPKWGQTETDTHVFSTDTSRDRREIEGTTTNITQMYNLVTGYHAGTNRATFLMLPRPHTLQPTVQRTFVQGLREIEGMQDFFFVATRPENVEQICIQANLETGHIVDLPPTEVEVEPAESDEYERDSVTVAEIRASVLGVHLVSTIISGAGRLFGADPIRDEAALPVPPNGYHGFEHDSWEFDPSRGDPGHGAVSQEIEDDDNAGTDWLDGFQYYSQQPDTVVITGTLFSTGWYDSKTFHRRFIVHVRRKRVVPENVQHEQNRQDLLITRRNLSACVVSEDGCIKTAESKLGELKAELDIIDEQFVDLKGGISAALDNLHSAMTSGASSLTRHDNEPLSFVDTEFVARHLLRVLPDKTLNTPLHDIEPGIDEEATGCKNVSEVLKTPLSTLSRRLNVSIEEAAALRRRAVGLPETRPAETTEKAG